MKKKEIGDFKLLDKYSSKDSDKWLDRLTSCVVSHWHDDLPAIHLLYDYSNGNYAHEICYGNTFFSHFKNEGALILMEGINIEFKNTTMDNIKVDNGCVLDRFRKQVLDIVKS